jgi:hypothetical protein
MSLSEMRVTKVERPGYCEATATHLPTGTTATGESFNPKPGEARAEAKRAAYAAVARKLNLPDVAKEYE